MTPQGSALTRYSPCQNALGYQDGLLDTGGKAAVFCMGCGSGLFQTGEGAQHIVWALYGGVAHAGAAAHAQLKLAKPRVATLVAHEGIQLLMIDVPAVSRMRSACFPCLHASLGLSSHYCHQTRSGDQKVGLPLRKEHSWRTRTVLVLYNAI